MSLNAAETAAEAVHSGSMLIGAGLILGGAAAAARVVITSATAAACARRDGSGDRGDSDSDSDSDDAEAPSSSPNKSARAAKFALLRRRAGSASGLAMMGLGGGSSGGGGRGGEAATANNNNTGPPPSAPSPPHLLRSASAAEAGGARFGGGGAAAADNIGADEAEEACRGYLPWDDLTADDEGDDGEAAANSYYLSRCVAVDCTHPRLPTLTHHRANRNPPGLSPLSDTSTGLVLSALAQLSSWRCPRLVKEVLARPYATCNHFDVDGLLALWCFLPQNRAHALRLEPILRHAARIGDFREAYLCPDLVSALGNEDKLTFIREAYSALKVATWVWATERLLFSAPYAKKDAAEKYRWFLPRLGRVLADPEAYWSEWQRDYSAAVSGFDLLAGPDALVERWWPAAAGGGGGGEGGGGSEQEQQQQPHAPAAGGALGGLLGGVNLVIGGIGNLLQLGAAGGGTSSSSGGGGGGSSGDTNEDDGGESGEGGGSGGGSARPPAQEALGGGYGYGPLPTSSSRPDGAPPTTTTLAQQPFDPRNPCPLAVVRAPEPQRYSALFSHTCGCDAVLALYDGRRYELELKYTTFVQLASRAAWPRVDLRPLAAALNDVEMRSAAGAARAARAAAAQQQQAAGGVGGGTGGGGFDNNDDSAAAAAALAACNGLEPVVLTDGAVVPPVRWVADALTDPGPLLRLERVEASGGGGGEGGNGGAGEEDAATNSVRVLKLPKPQRYGDPCDRPIYSSTIPPAKFQAVVASYFESSLRETGAKPRGPVTRVVATPPGSSDVAGLGFGGGSSADNTAGAGWSWEAVNALNDDLRRRVAPAWLAALLERDAAGALDGLVAHGGHEQGVVGGGAAAGAGAAAFGGAAAGWGPAAAMAARAGTSAAAATTAAALTTASGWHYDTERSGRRRHTHHHHHGGGGGGGGGGVGGGGGTTPPFQAANPVFGMAAGEAGEAATGDAATHQQQLLLHEQQHAIPLVASPAPAYGSGGALDPPPHLSEPSPILAAAAAAAGSNDPSAPLRALAAALPALQRRKPWTLLYSTARDGTSLATLLRKAGAAAGGRAAPTVLLVRDRHGTVFGAYCTEPWRATTGRFFGTGESWVFRLCPGAPMRYPWVGPEPGGGVSSSGGGAAAAAAAAADSAADSDDRHRRAAAPPRTDFFQYATPDGLGVGGGGHFAIFLDEELLHGSSAHCLTYASPCLASGEEFGVRDVELWWVGGVGGVGSGDYRLGAVQVAMAGAGVVGGGIAPLGRSGGV
jgi:hypothetical protein